MDIKRHYIQKKKAQTRITNSRTKKVSNTPLINHERVFFLPPLPIKFGLINNFFTTLDQNSAGLCI